MAVEVEYFLCFRERRLCRRAVGVGTLRGGLRSAVAAGRMGADKPIRICFSGAAPPAPGDELGTQVRPAPCSEACPLAPPYVKENLAGGGNSEGDRARRGRRPRLEAWLNADLAPRSERGRPSGKGRPARRGAGAANNPRFVMPPPSQEACARWLAPGRGGSESFHWPPADQADFL